MEYLGLGFGKPHHSPISSKIGAPHSPFSNLHNCYMIHCESCDWFIIKMVLMIDLCENDITPIITGYDINYEK